jgi:branched-chain amino acid transport system substrate-binding protein
VTSRRFVHDVLSARGVAIVADETFNDGDRDFRIQLVKIRASRPDVIMCSAYYQEGAHILSQAEALGLSVPVLGEDSWQGPIAAITPVAALRRLYFASVASDPSHPDSDELLRFAAAFAARHGAPPDPHAAAGYAAVQVVAHAIEIGGYDGPSIKQALYNIDMATAFGRVRYDANGDNAGVTLALYQLDEHNNRVVAEPALVTATR